MTLLEEMEQRQRSGAAFERGELDTSAGASHSTSSDNSNSAGEALEISDVDVKRGYAFIVSITMFVVHATLATLSRLQYGQEVSLLLVCKEAFPSIPIFAALIYFLHPLQSTLMQGAATTFSIGIGCWLVYLVNEEGYYASMRRAPALGSLWIWLFVELEWYYGVISLAAVAGYLKFNEYSLT